MALSTNDLRLELERRCASIRLGCHVKDGSKKYSFHVNFDVVTNSVGSKGLLVEGYGYAGTLKEVLKQVVDIQRDVPEKPDNTDGPEKVNELREKLESLCWDIDTKYYRGSTSTEYTILVRFDHKSNRMASLVKYVNDKTYQGALQKTVDAVENPV